MGMFDWLSSPIAEGSTQTWGNLLGQAISMSGSQSGKSFGSLMQNQYRAPNLQQNSGLPNMQINDAPITNSPQLGQGSHYLASTAGVDPGKTTDLSSIMSLMAFI